MDVKSIFLKPGKEKSVERFHPWIFSGALMKGNEDLKNGDLVQVKSADGKFLCIGHYQDLGSIAVRIISFEETTIDQDFWNKKFINAMEVRDNLNLLHAYNNVFRLIHGEGDGLPGLIVDIYNDTAVIQCHSVGMLQSLEFIKNGILNAFDNDLKAIYNKSSDTISREINVKDSYIYKMGEPDKLVLEYGHKFSVDWETGQKTGYFIDQRENRKLIAKYASRKKVLNTFCYSGGFSIFALEAGAKLVHSLDSSQKAIDLVENNIRLNGFSNSDKHKSIVADAMDYMKNLEEEYDIIILDPPAFAKHKKSRHKAVQGYKRLNYNAIKQIKSGGIIFTFSCSQVVDKQLFANTVIAAGIESGRSIRILEQLHQPGDHPINAYHPEGEYLKGLVIQVD
ncbi:MAG: class I SAM-dependent rRNA methyltransferase [Crocinitomicaceae bacterium]